MFTQRSKVDMVADVVAQHQAQLRALSKTIWCLEHWRDGRLLDKQWDLNLLLNEGANYLISLGFAAAPPTAITQWYVGLFENDYTPLVGDNYATNGWTEFTNYDEPTRPVWTPGTVGGGSVDNSANKATFSVNATRTIYGGYLLGGGSAPQTKGNTAGGGTAYAAVRFAASRGVQSGDELKVTGIVTLSDDPT